MLVACSHYSAALALCWSKWYAWHHCEMVQFHSTVQTGMEKRTQAVSASAFLQVDLQFDFCLRFHDRMHNKRHGWPVAMVVRIEKHKTQAIFLSLNHFKCKYNNSIDISSLLLLSLFFVQGTHVPRPVSYSWICWSYATYSLFAPYIWFTWFFTCPIYYMGFFRVVLWLQVIFDRISC